MFWICNRYKSALSFTGKGMTSDIFYCKSSNKEKFVNQDGSASDIVYSCLSALHFGYFSSRGIVGRF